MRFRALIRSLFAFSATETRGFWAFITLLLFGWLIFWFYLESRPGIAFVHPEDAQKLDSLYQLLMPADAAAEDTTGELQPKALPTPQLREPMRHFPFDPNQVSYEELKQLGLNDRLARQLLAYRKAGGSFRYKEDLKRLYSMSDSVYNRLNPYIELPTKPATAAVRKDSLFAAKPKKEAPLLLDLNQADSLTFLELYGIGPVFAGRLVRFREALGGFVSVEQVGEMYGLPPETFAGIKDNLYVATTFKPELIRINVAEVEELGRHPYISYAQARVLVAYRQQHGPFKQKEDLLKIHTFSEALLSKLAPYLTTD